jgi:hypothetical protein
MSGCSYDYLLRKEGDAKASAKLASAQGTLFFDPSA